MQKGEGIQDVEKAEKSAAIASGGLVANTKELDIEQEKDEVGSDSRPSETSSIDGNDMLEERARDLEALSTAPSTTPPHSVFSKRKKQFIVFLVAWAGFFSPLSATIYFPALNTLAQEFNVSSTLVNLTLTSYMIFQGLAPTIFGDLADMAGRRPAYAIGFVVYIGACSGLALQTSYAALFVLRCLQSTGISGMLALGNGVVADIATSAERGIWMGYATSGLMIAPAIAPIIGGVLAQFLGWRAIFWFLVIMAAIYLIPFFVCFPETGRNVVGNGSIPPQGWNMSLLNYLEARKAVKIDNALTWVTLRDESRAAQPGLGKKQELRFPNPLGTLHVIFEKDVGLLLFYNSLVYTAFYDVIGSAPYLFREIYSFNNLQIGLCFIPFGVGGFCAPICCGRLMDWNYRRVAKKAGITIDRKQGDNLKDFPLERARIEVAVPFLILGDAALLCYGWIMHLETSLAAPLILQFIIGISLTGAFNCMSVILVDFYPLSPSTATAANNLVRCLMGAAGTAIINIMIDSMGRGWCFTFIAAVVSVASPILWVLVKWGPGWREARRKRLEEKT